MIFYIPKVLEYPNELTFDLIECKFIFQKIYAYNHTLSIRVVAEIKSFHLEIKSIHFIKNSLYFHKENKNTTSR